MKWPHSRQSRRIPRFLQEAHPLLEAKAIFAWATQAEERPPATFESKDGTRIVYEASGQGPALLLVHGGGSTPERWRHIAMDSAPDLFVGAVMSFLNEQ